MKKAKNIIKTVADILLIVFVAAFALLTITMVAMKAGGNGQPLIGGYGFGRVITGSMETTIPTGSFVLVHETEASEINVEDVIMFYSNDPSFPEGYPVTHRVIEITQNDGRFFFITKGDANSSADEYPASEDDIVGKVVFSSAWIGKIIEFSQKPFIYPILILLLAADLVVNIVIVTSQAKTLKEQENGNDS